MDERKKFSLSKIKDDFKRSAMCVLMENQNLMNATATTKYVDSSKLLDLVASTFTNLMAWDLISIQPMLGPTTLIHYLCADKDLQIKDDSVAAHTRIFKRKISLDFGTEDTGKDLRSELDTEFLVDLWNTAATVAHYNKDIEKEQLKLNLESFIKHMEEKLGSKVTWVVTNESNHHKYKEVLESLGLKIHIDRTAIKGILLGRKGDTYIDSGYFYCPYVPFTLTPSFDSYYLILTRCAKRLINPNYYGRIVIEE